MKYDLQQAISSKYDSAIEVLLSSQQQQEEDVFASFTKSIQCQLKQLPPINATAAMAEMQSVMSKHTRQVLLSTSRVKITSNKIIKPARSTSPINIQYSDSACSLSSFDSGRDHILYSTSTPSTSSGQSHRNDVIERAMYEADMFGDNDF